MSPIHCKRHKVPKTFEVKWTEVYESKVNFYTEYLALKILERIEKACELYLFICGQAGSNEEWVLAEHLPSCAECFSVISTLNCCECMSMSVRSDLRHQVPSKLFQ